MPSFRVKLIFERPAVGIPEQCWMLVDKTSCKLVRDLEYLIAKKFFVAGNTVLNLYLDEFLLPSQEKIDLIRDNDIIRVKEEVNCMLSNENSGKTSTKEKICSKKRKHEESSDSKRKIKKAKHSFDKKTDKNNMEDKISEKPSSSNFTTKSVFTKNNLINNTHKEKHENVNKMSDNNSAPKFSANAETKTKKKKLKKRPSKDNSIAVKLNSFWGKVAGSRPQLNPTSSAKSMKPSEPDSTQSVMNGAKDNSVNLPVAVTVNNGRVERQTVSKIQPGKNGSSMSKAKVTKEVSNRRNNVGISQTIEGNHIRFDTEEDEHTTANSLVTPMNMLVEESTADNMLNDAFQQSELPLMHPRILSIRGAATPTANGTPNLSPIEPNKQNCFAGSTSVSGDEAMNKQRRGKGDKRKDSYTNKSVVMESTRVEKESLVNFPEKDFSTFPLLHGPPRIGDIVAYKIIEISQSYTPEVSGYKEGKVLSFDSLSKQLKLKLTKESLARVKGDGRVSLKFELFENNDGEDQPVVTEEISDEVEIQWTSMIEPRLVTAPATV